MSFLLLPINFIHLSAQGYCQTDHSSSFPFTCTGNSQNDQMYRLKVYFHVAIADNGDRQSEVVVNNSFEIINNLYNQHNIYFEWDCNVIEHYNDDWANNMLLLNGNNVKDEFHEDGIDILLLPDNAEFKALSFGFIGGGSAVYVSGVSPNGIPLAASNAISHEIGHVLNLFHTFHNCGTSPENPDGSECNIKGDRLCDTNPDPGMNYSVNEICEWIDTTGAECQDEFELSLYNMVSLLVVTE